MARGRRAHNPCARQQPDRGAIGPLQHAGTGIDSRPVGQHVIDQNDAPPGGRGARLVGDTEGAGKIAAAPARIEAPARMRGPREHQRIDEDGRAGRPAERLRRSGRLAVAAPPRPPAAEQYGHRQRVPARASRPPLRADAPPCRRRGAAGRPGSGSALPRAPALRARPREAGAAWCAIASDRGERWHAGGAHRRGSERQAARPFAQNGPCASTVAPHPAEPGGSSRSL